jgi:hypothetical protein
MAGGVQRFEDLIAWQKARELTASIYEVTRTGSFAAGYGLARQIQRAAVSVISNVAEGFERGRRAEFAQFLSIAAGYLDQITFNVLQSRADEVTRVLGGLRSSVEQQSRPGLRSG